MSIQQGCFQKLVCKYILEKYACPTCLGSMYGVLSPAMSVRAEMTTRSSRAESSRHGHYINIKEPEPQSFALHVGSANLAGITTGSLMDHRFLIGGDPE